MQHSVLMLLRKAGYEVYDFRNPSPENFGFQWTEIAPNWEQWSVKQFREGLTHPIAEKGYAYDYNAMQWADVCVLLLPCGRSAHLEAGYFAGHPEKKLIILMLEPAIPELMYKMADVIAASTDEMLQGLEEVKYEVEK